MMLEKSKKRKSIEDILGSRARMRILRFLAEEKELNISKIIKKTHLNHSNVTKHLRFLQSVNFVQEKKFGRIRIYRYKIEDIRARSLKNLIDLWNDLD